MHISGTKQEHVDDDKKPNGLQIKDDQRVAYFIEFLFSFFNKTRPSAEAARLRQSSLC